MHKCQILTWSDSLIERYYFPRECLPCKRLATASVDPLPDGALVRLLDTFQAAVQIISILCAWQANGTIMGICKAQLANRTGSSARSDWSRSFVVVVCDYVCDYLVCRMVCGIVYAVVLVSGCILICLLRAGLLKGSFNACAN